MSLKRSSDIVEPNVIQETKDYDKFKILDANRRINKTHVQRLIDSLETKPYLARIRPVLVNRNFEIIDGQHRFLALKALEQPIFYMVASGTDISTAQRLNALQRNWTVMDYAHSFAATGNYQYQLFLQLHSEYPVSLTVLMYFMVGRADKLTHLRFRKGELKSRKDKKRLIQQLDQLTEFGDVLPFWKDYGFGMAALKLINNENYDHDRMMKKLAIRPFKRQVSQSDYLRELETTYNYHAPVGKQVRFF